MGPARRACLPRVHDADRLYAHGPSSARSVHSLEAHCSGAHAGRGLLGSSKVWQKGSSRPEAPEGLWFAGLGSREVVHGPLRRTLEEGRGLKNSPASRGRAGRGRAVCQRRREDAPAGNVGVGDVAEGDLACTTLPPQLEQALVLRREEDDDGQGVPRLLGTAW